MNKWMLVILMMLLFVPVTAAQEVTPEAPVVVEVPEENQTDLPYIIGGVMTVGALILAFLTVYRTSKNPVEVVEKLRFDENFRSALDKTSELVPPSIVTALIAALQKGELVIETVDGAVDMALETLEGKPAIVRANNAREVYEAIRNGKKVLVSSSEVDIHELATYFKQGGV